MSRIISENHSNFDLVEHIGLIELAPIEIELDRAPGVGLQQIGEIVGELLSGGIIDGMGKIGANASDGARRPRWSWAVAPCV